MIDSRKLIEAIQQECKLNAGGLYEEDIIKIINEQSKVGEWIPCSERLPDKSGNYIVTTKATTKFNETYYDVIEATYWAGNKAWEDTVDDISLYVIAWQPLPAPYKGEQND